MVDIHCCNRASGHICHVIEVNMHQVSIFYQICYKPAKSALLTSYFKQMSINHLQNSFSYILWWYLKYINIQIDYTSGLKNRWIWPQCPTKWLEFAAFDGLIWGLNVFRLQKIGALKLHAKKWPALPKSQHLGSGLWLLQKKTLLLMIQSSSILAHKLILRV